MVKDGCLINFWNDDWVKDVGPLKYHFTGQGPLDKTICVCDASLPNGG